MGGVVGAVHGKLILGTVALMFSVKVDQRNVVALVDGDAPISAISEQLAQRLQPALAKQRSGDRDNVHVWLHLEGGMFRIALPVAEHELTNRADLRLGQDILSSHYIRLDFHRRTGSLILPDRLASETRKMIAIPITISADGTILLPARLNDGSTTSARLRFSFHEESAPSGSSRVQAAIALLGEDDQPAIEIDDYHVDLEGRTSKAFVDLFAFRDRAILLDLRHHRLWVSGARRTL